MRPLLILLLLLSIAACRRSDTVGQTEGGELVLGDAEVTEVMERGVTPGNRTLVLDGFNGAVTLRGTPDAQASLRFTKRARGRDDRTALRTLEGVHIEEAGDNEAYRYTMRAGDDARASVDVEGTVPRGSRVEVRLTNGTVSLTALEGPLTVRVENGRVQIEGARSNVDVEATNGDIEAGFGALPVAAEVRLTTTNGGITLGLPEGAGAQIDAETSVGGIRAEGLTFRAQRLDPLGAGNRFRATLGGGNANVTLRTQNGSITLRPYTPSPSGESPPASATAPDTTARP